MKLLKNMLIQWLPFDDNEETLTERVLFIEDTKGCIVTIDIFSKQALPVFKTYEEVSAAIDSGFAVILKKDPYK